MTHLDHDAPILDDSPRDEAPQCGYFPIVQLPKLQSPSIARELTAIALFISSMSVLFFFMYVCLVWLGVMR